MYAVIESGGKQYKVAEGDHVDVELLESKSGGKVELRPVMIVDGSKVLATPKELGKASVAGKVVGETKGPKIVGFTYRAKSRSRKHWGHRQHYSTVEITKISKGATTAAKPKTETAEN